MMISFFLSKRKAKKSADYIIVLEDYLLPFAKRKYGANYVFQQDNAPIHTSELISHLFQERNTNVLSWPDLNPIENAWAKLSRLIYKDGR